MIEFLARLPTDMMIFITMAVLGLAGNADSAEMADLDALIKLIANGPCHRSHDASSSRQQT
jgi:hypothetical protein